MTDEQILKKIEQSLSNTVSQPFTLTPETDLLGDRIIDSLDAIQFFFELEKQLGMKFPSGDLEEGGFYQVSKIMQYIRESS